MRILVCGGRDYGHVIRTKPTIAEEPLATQRRLEEYQFIQDTLNRLANDHSANFKANANWLPTDITIISGGAKGADSAADRAARAHQ